MAASVPESHPAFGMVLNHNAMRVDLARFDKYASSQEAIDRGAAQLLTQWFGFISRSLHHHHEAEDEDIYPLLAARDATFEPAVAPLIEEHTMLTTLVTAVEKTLGVLSIGTDEGRVAQSKVLAQHVAALNKLLVDHLAREEKELIDRMEKLLGEKDIRGIENKMRRRAPLKDVALVLPWIYDTATPEERQIFMRKVPWLFRTLMRFSWLDRYKKLTAPLAPYRAT